MIEQISQRVALALPVFFWAHHPVWSFIPLLFFVSTRQPVSKQKRHWQSQWHPDLSARGTDRF